MRANDTSSAALDRSELKSSQSSKGYSLFVGIRRRIIVIIRLAPLPYGDKQLSGAAKTSAEIPTGNPYPTEFDRVGYVSTM
jgi:hypothetical protein